MKDDLHKHQKSAGLKFGLTLSPCFLQAVCDHDRSCGRGFSCDRHFGLCVPLRGEGHYCRRDAQCVRGLSCMFGKCHRSIPNGQEGKSAKKKWKFRWNLISGNSLSELDWNEMMIWPKITSFSLIQGPDVKLTGIVGHLCAVPDTMVSRCARDVWFVARAAMCPMVAWHSA